MSYRVEDWKHVSGVLGPRIFNGWSVPEEEPDQLPCAKELDRELKRNIGCQECECEDEYNDVVSYVQDLKFDQHNTYREKLEEFGASTVEQIGILHRTISSFIEKNDEFDRAQYMEFLEHLQLQLEDIVPVRLTISSLMSMGVINKDQRMSKILTNLVPRVCADYHAENNCWRTEFNDVAINIYANRFSLFYGGNIIFFHKDNIIVGTQQYITWNWLEQYLSDWCNPTQEEIELAKMIQPEYAQSLDILKVITKKLSS